MIYVIADDLTGANDSGVQLAKQGLSTTVSILTDQANRVDQINLTDNTDQSDYLDHTNQTKNSIQSNENVDVFVIDTETRELEAVEAIEKFNVFISKINYQSNSDIIYKKIDSTLRGNIGHELDIIMHEMQRDICIFAPSFPSNKRISVGGYLLVTGNPLGKTQYYNGKLKPGEDSYIPSLLKEQSKLPIGLIPLKDVMNGKDTILKRLKQLYQDGKKIIVCDAVEDKHLENIILGGFEFNGSVLYSGSAGLANFLTKIYDKKTFKKGTVVYPGASTVLIIVGTRNQVMDEQIEFLKSKMAIIDMKIDLKDVLKQNTGVIQKYLDKLKQNPLKKSHILVRLDPVYKDSKNVEDLLMTQGIPFRELEIRIRSFLARISNSIVDKTGINNLIMTGGDTAIGFCQALGINNLKILDEVLPGIPLAVNKDKQNYKLNLVTKAGGFGQEDTLYKLVKRLKEYQTQEVEGFKKPV